MTDMGRVVEDQPEVHDEDAHGDGVELDTTESAEGHELKLDSQHVSADDVGDDWVKEEDVATWLSTRTSRTTK